ncbi:MAG: bifunctional chorismate mutase/prephenate dehydrogenase [Gemmatimonadetes bacterium]|nr:bifunctional chorismate mutase/prephenate dehydrogenase [Gemmatimonadota bacterium]
MATEATVTDQADQSTEQRGSGAPRPLPVLRAMIDALDRDLLQTLARRATLVAEVAEVKRREGRRIRDPEREAAVLGEWTAQAQALGLPADEVESIVRMLLRASRDQQAALRAEVPVDEPVRTVAVIGGAGRMGRRMAQLFADLGHHVLVADVDTALRPAQAAEAADVTVVSVPIDRTEAVIREVGPHVPPHGLLMDVTSLKAAPLRAMLEATVASVVGTHPLFGPGVHSLQGQRVVLCRGRGHEWAAWVTRMLEARGLVVVESGAEAHDRRMALVQVLTHYQTQVMGVALARLGEPLEATLPFTSPAYLLELYVTARHFGQDPGLYGPIEMRNPRTAEVTEAFQAAAREVAEVLAAGDQARFAALFEEVRGYFGPFTQEAMVQSGVLIDRVGERR